MNFVTENVFQKFPFKNFLWNFFSNIVIWNYVFFGNCHSKIFILKISFLNLFSKICCLNIFFLEGKNLDNFINKILQKKVWKKFKIKIFGKKVFRKNFVNKFCTNSDWSWKRMKFSYYSGFKCIEMDWSELMGDEGGISSFISQNIRE